MTAFKVLSAAAALMSALMVLASERDPPKPPARLADAIAERWPPEQPAAPKADRLPLAQAAEDFPAEVEPQPIAAVDPQMKPEKLSRQRERRDICQRHGMHKQVTRGGRSWRCRR